MIYLQQYINAVIIGPAINHAIASIPVLALNDSWNKPRVEASHATIDFICWIDNECRLRNHSASFPLHILHLRFKNARGRCLTALAHTTTTFTDLYSCVKRRAWSVFLTNERCRPATLQTNVCWARCRWVLAEWVQDDHQDVNKLVLPHGCCWHINDGTFFCLSLDACTPDILMLDSLPASLDTVTSCEKGDHGFCGS